MTTTTEPAPQTDTSPPPALSSRTIAFAVAHALLILGVLSWAAVRMRAMEQDKQLPPLRTEPLVITPLYDDPDVISDDQLQQVLWKLRPRLRGPNPKVNYVDHALRFWGVEAEFDDPMCLSGVEMRNLLTDHRQLAAAWEDHGNSLLFNTVYGVGLRVAQGGTTASHVDHTTATLAEVGTPLDFPLITPEGETSFESLLEHARRDFRLNQTEYEWSALVFALYMPTDQAWLTREGQWISFDRLAERIMRQDWIQGVCAGNHRLFTLAALVRIHREHQPLFSEAMHEQVIAHLKQATAVLVAHQAEAGYWDLNWDGTPMSSLSVATSYNSRGLVTGHALEWWAIAPEEVQPPREVVIRAAHWLAQTILEMPDSQIRKNFPFLTHAGRALALWRSRRPAEVVHSAPAE